MVASRDGDPLYDVVALRQPRHRAVDDVQNHRGDLLRGGVFDRGPSFLPESGNQPGQELFSAKAVRDNHEFPRRRCHVTIGSLFNHVVAQRHAHMRSCAWEGRRGATFSLRAYQEPRLEASLRDPPEAVSPRACVSVLFQTLAESTQVYRSESQRRPFAPAARAQDSESQHLLSRRIHGLRVVTTLFGLVPECRPVSAVRIGR